MVVLSKPGAQVPTMPLVEVVGKADKDPPLQTGLTAANVGVMFVAMVTVAVAKQPLLSV